MKIIEKNNLIQQRNLNELASLLFDPLDGKVLTLVATKALENSYMLNNNILYINYLNFSYIYRCIFNYAVGITEGIKIVENNCFETLAIMIDCSRNGVANIDFVKKNN